MNRFAHIGLLATTTLLLAACGGGDDTGNDPAAGGSNTGGTTAALTCNLAGYVAGSVELPSAAQLAAYAGTFNGDEGQYGANPGDPFVKSASAALVLSADGSLSYKGKSYTLDSACIDKAAGPYGKLLYLVSGQGHFDVADKVDATLGQAWGVSPVDGNTIFTNGKKP